MTKDEFMSMVRNQLERLSWFRTSRLTLLFHPQPLGELPVGGDLGGLIGGIDHHTSPSKSKDRGRRITSKPMEFMSTSGLRISVGKNNSQNDQLTCKLAGKGDGSSLISISLPSGS